MKKEFYSNGKLLITGEYLVLDGAKALALPTKFGQKLIVEKGKNKEIKWSSYDADNTLWFEATIPFETILREENNSESESIKTTLIKILHQAYLLKPDFINQSRGYIITTELSFPRNWGLGTSSTLINNIGQWIEIDAYVLLTKSFGGSGYDIACAQNNNPILYHLENGKPIIEKITFEPEFTENLFFVYLDKKQSSKASIVSYYTNKNRTVAADIVANNKISAAVLSAKTLQDFALALEEHEVAMSAILKIRSIKESLFPDFDGTIKSLGAWGGDFVLAISEQNPTSYFNNKGFLTVVPYADMIF